MVYPVIFWVLLSPFAAGAIVYVTPPLNRFVGRHYWPALALAGAGGVMVSAGALHGIDSLGMALLAVGAPLLGFGFWTRSGGGGSGPEKFVPEPEPEDDGYRVDWDQFMRDLERWKAVRAQRTIRPARPPARRREHH